MKRVLFPFSFAVLLASVPLLLAQAKAPTQPQLNRLDLPKGFSVSLYADNVPGARSMASPESARMDDRLVVH